jgi:hypothetical protein
MTRKVFIGLIVTLLFAVGLLAVQFPHDWIAPGDMLAGHKSIERDCFACHTPLFGASNEKCVACHKVADIGLRTTTGLSRPASTKPAFHQHLVEQDCTGCHREHDLAIAVGVRLVSFSHDLIDSTMLATCTNCHVKPADTFHQAITGSCSQCHATTGWTPATFDHDKHFELDRDHNVACTTCHVAGNFKTATCYGCHEHQPDKIRRKHEGEGITDFQNCASCHRNAHDEPKRRGRDS